jgi:hypothetical protein
MEYIPELKIGNVYRDSMRTAYHGQFNELLKLWIWLDGTRHIFEMIAERHHLTLLSPHPCSICAQLYKTPEIKDTLVALLHDNADSIVFRAAIKARLGGRAPVSDASAMKGESACHQENRSH